MRIIFLLLLFIAIGNDAISQTPRKKVASSNRAVPSKPEIQSQMNEATNGIVKEIAELEKQLKTETDEETIKDLKEQIEMLKKQLKMMQGLNKNVSMMSDKAVQEAVEDDGSATVPKRDMTRISMLPKKVLSEAELLLFIKNVQAGVEKIIPVIERTEALAIYNETKAQYKITSTVANAGTGLWLVGHWEKALFLMGKVCMEDINDADNLNNYAAFLVMTGGEQAAIPILEFLNSKYPNNSTILNNIGQAWFGLGDMDNAKKYLNATIELYPNHSMANSTMANISLAGPNPDTPRAINFLKASLKGGYDPQKEAELEQLGYATKYDDLPAFNYPMKPDPFGLIPLLNSWPQKIQSNIDDPAPAYELQRYMNGVEEFKRELLEENVEIGKKLHEHGKKLVTDKIYNQEFMEPHNCPAHILAVRTSYALKMEEIQSGSGMPAQLLMPYFSPYIKSQKRPMSIHTILYYLKKFWITEVLEPMQHLASDAQYNNPLPNNCKEADAIANAYYAKRADIYNRGVDRIKKEFINKSDELKVWIFLELYATPDYQSEKGMGDAYALVDYLNEKIAKQSVENRTYEELLRFIENGKQYIGRLRSNCDQSGVPDPTQPAKDMKGYKVKRVECEYVKKIALPGIYTFELRCNTMYEKVNLKTKKRLPDIPKGAAEIASPRTQIVGPVSGRGPNTFYDAMYEENKYRPLCLESKEESQFGLEFDKWGKLIACNFQLSEDGTTLKDPDSIESGVDSRWSWNAIASSKKSYLNKLILK
jgi:TolA-binding protein